MASGTTTSETSAAMRKTPWQWRLLLAVLVIALLVVLFFVQGQISLSLQSALGFVGMLALAACFSRNLTMVSWRTVLFGVGLQVLLALVILKLEITGLTMLGIPDGFQPGREIFQLLGSGVSELLNFSNRASGILFGPLADREKMTEVFGPSSLLVLAVLPPIVFISSLFSILYFFGILQMIVQIMGRVMMFLMRTSGAETLSAAANVFMGQTEAPLIIKPYIQRMTQSELLAMMVGGMATISGGVMVAYISLGADQVALLTTSVMAAPCGLYLSKLIFPETEQPLTTGSVKLEGDHGHANVVDAAAAGASDGMKLAINVIAMLIAFLALLFLVDALLGQIATGQTLVATIFEKSGWSLILDLLMLGLVTAIVGRIVFWVTGLCKISSQPVRWLVSSLVCAIGLVAVNYLLAGFPADTPLSLSAILGRLFSPLALLMGVAEKDVFNVGQLLGIKLAANEFLAFDLLTTQLQSSMESRSVFLTNIALTGFANFGSVGIQIGGIGALAPERRSDLAKLGIPAMFIGFLATIMNAALAGVFL